MKKGGKIMRVKRIIIRADMIVELLIKKSRSIRIIEGIPEDSKLLRAHYDANTDSYSLLIESQEFEEVLEGTAIPTFLPVFEAREDGS